ncbi:MAG: Ig-like domain repeat protein [Methanobrevibacter sp.]|nr:Ig-like domain repeat protein [Methanobrevibacter sp.]
MKVNKNIFICAILVAMMLFCVSAVSAEDSNLNVATNVALDGITEGDALSIAEEGSSSGGDLLTVDGATVTNDTFFNYFDDTGVINKSISSSDLTFNGTFSGLGIDTITIDTPKTISGDNALFKNIGFKILSDNVTIKGIGIDFACDGAAIDVQADDVTVDGVTIDVANTGAENTYAVRVAESDNFNLVNSVINFNATGTTVIQHAVEIRDSTNSKVRKNEINANLPALDVDYSGATGIDMDLPLAIAIQNGENITINENNVTVDVTKAVGYYPTLDSLLANGPKNLVISDNSFTQTDFSGEGKAGYSNVVDLYYFNGAQVTGNTILVNTTTGSEGAGTAYTIQATGPYTAFVVDGNQLTAEGKGPSLGVYSQNYMGGTDITITNNVIDVTGFATDNPWALVSGMELQDDKALVSGNTITVKSINDYDDANNLYGISYAQQMSGDHTYNITNNTVYSDSLYAVYIVNAVNSTVKENTLIAHDLSGNKAISIAGENNVVEKNIPPTKAEIIIDSPAVWTGNNGNISVVVTDAVGNVSIRIGDKIYENLKLVNNSVSQEINASDLTLGANEIEVTYYGDENYAETTAVGNLEVIDGVITADTFKYYFGEDKYLSDNVPEGATLDFQGSFISDNFTLYINKPVNVISSTGDALFDSNTTNRKWIMFNIVEGANNTNITGINFLNADLFIEAPYVTVDSINAVANMQGVGSQTGFVVFRTDAAYGTIKNSYLENGGTGSSILVYGYGAPYGTIDNNIINVTGNSGNLIGANAYVGKGVTPANMTVTNNQIFNEQTGTSSSYAVTLMGSYNFVENNTIRHKGAGIVNANVAWASGAKDPMENNTYRNNVIIGTGMTAAIGSLVENNTMTGALSFAGAGIVATGNTAGSMTIGTTSAGGNITVDNNTINGAVTINKAATGTVFTNNLVKDTVTVNSNKNTITDNQISTEKAYAIDLKSTTNNTVKYNTLSSADKMGDDAVNFAEDKDNVVKNNGMNAIIQIEVVNSWSGDNNTINITVVNATGTVNVNINGNEYKNIALVDSKAQFEIPANNIEVGLNDLTVTFNGNKVISSESKATTFYGLDNVVFTEVFFDFFDENGILKDSVPYTDLIFKGDFAKSKTVQYIVIDKPISISSDGASLSLIGIVIGCDNVTIDGLKLTTTVNSAASALGDLIAINANNVTLSNLNINYRVTRGDYDAIAIDAFDADNVKLINNTIVFASVISTDDYSANAINLDGVTNALVDNNTITTTLPGLLAQWENYDMDYFLMGLNYVNPVRIRASENITFTNNDIESNINNVGKTTPTIQALVVVGSDNVLVDSNSFKMIDTKSKPGSATYLYAFNFGYDKNLTVLNNNFYMSTTGGQDSAGAAYALQGVESEIYVSGNNITTISNGPNLGFYVASMMGGSSESVIANNFINVTGNATTSQQWALISGIEITNGNAKIYNNTIYTYNKAGYVEDAPVHGVSYGQYMYGERSLDVQNNTIITQGKYTVSVLEGTSCNVTGNTLYAEELFGDDSVAPGYEGIVENNTPPFDAEIIIEGQPVWIGSNSTVTVTVPSATGNVTIVIGNKTYKEVPLVNGTVTLPVDATDLVDGANDVNVTYNGDLYIKVGNAIGNLQVISGVITNETFSYYFNKSNGNKLADIVPEGVTLDFQGPFVGGDFSLYINKPENIVSTTGDAVFDSGEKPNYNWFKFNVVEGANHTNITGISIINGDLFIKGASYVTVDDISMKANMRGVGSGTGFLSIHSNAYYTTVKNSHFENGGTGSSCVVLGKGGKYATFDNNVFDITGSSGNVLSSNVFVGAGELPQFVNYTNNVINSQVAASGFMYGITVCGEGNIIENNSLLNFKGNGIINQFGATSTKNIYRNNTITGGGSMAIGTYSLVDNNHIDEGALTVTEGCTFVNNTAKSLTISGKNVVAEDNVVLTTVTISAAAKNTTFADNIVNGLVTVNSAENNITNNIIIADNSEYAVDLKSTENNTVTDNILYAQDLVGDKAVNFLEDKDNTVENNFPIDPVLVVEVADINVGENATINVSFNENITGTVEVIVDGKKYPVDVTEGKGQFNVSDLAANKYTVGVSYEGDLLYIPTTNSTVFSVNKLDVKDDVNVTVPNDVKPGDNVTVNVTVPDATGNVTVIVDGESTVVPLDENGTASVPIDNIGAGNHAIVVMYSGDDTHAPTYKATTVNVEKLDSQLDITVPSDVKPGDNVTVGVAVPGATGNVTVIVDGESTVVPLSEGTASVPIDNIGVGKHGIVVIYSGDDTFAPTYKATSVNVEKLGSSFNVTEGTTFETYAVETAVGEKGALYAFVLRDSNGNPIANATVTFAYKTVVFNSTTDENGTLYLGISTYLAQDALCAMSYLGDETHNATFVAFNFKIQKKPTAIKAAAKTYKVSKKNKYLTVTLKTIKGASRDGKTYLKKGKKITLTVNGKTYVGTTNANGKVTFKITNLNKKGKYTAVIKYAGSDTYTSAKTKVKLKVY